MSSAPIVEPAFDPNTPFLPPEHLYRTLVLCFDGTGDQFDSDNSNIVEFFSMLKKDDREHQMVYYQAGIGTYITPQIATPVASRFSKLLDEAIAWNLDAHVMSGYEFLMQNYRAGDRICIFGFSRGAYIARALAGMIHKVGLLPACNHQQVPFAYKMFTRTDEIGWKQSNAFKKAFSVDVKIEFIGVWDTVNSVGLIPRRLPFTTSNTIVRTFRHALALDERRAKFKPNYWNEPSVREARLGVEGQKPNHDAHKKPVKGGTLKALERKYSESGEQVTDVEEVWFAGCHCDIGGGSVENGTPNTLARIPFRWMIRECFKAKTGIFFMTDALRGVGLDPATLYPIVGERPPALPLHGIRIQPIPSKGETPAPASSNDESARSSESPLLAGTSPVCTTRTEEEHDIRDVLSPIYDQLSLNPLWWILEVIPVRNRYQISDGKWEKKTRWNLGEPRYIPRQKKGVVKVHRSVQTRMEAVDEKGQRYLPMASFQKAKNLGNLVWVD